MGTVFKTVKVIAGITVIMLAACSSGSCFQETDALVKASLYSSETGQITAPDSITLYGAGRDTSLIYDRNRNLRQALIPLDPSAAECSFIAQINGISDTISFTYSSAPRFISKECGYTFFYTIDAPEFSENIIDSIKMVKNTLTTFNEENIRIYY